MIPFLFIAGHNHPNVAFAVAQQMVAGLRSLLQQKDFKTKLLSILLGLYSPTWFRQIMQGKKGPKELPSFLSRASSSPWFTEIYAVFLVKLPLRLHTLYFHTLMLNLFPALPEGTDSAGGEEAIRQHSQTHGLIFGRSCVEPGVGLVDPCGSLPIQDTPRF